MAGAEDVPDGAPGQQLGAAPRRWNRKDGGEHLTLYLAILINELPGASLHSNSLAPEALSSHPRQPLLVNNNSLFKNSSLNLFALLLSVPGFYPQKTWERCATCFFRASLAEPVSRSGGKTGTSLANTHNVIARQLGSATVKYSSWRHGGFISQ